jgi:predicted nuclease of predicted toxin-antitoxin system
MKLLLDQGLPRGTVTLLQQAGHDAVHVGDIGLASAEDDEILQHAAGEHRVVVTLDSDFHTLLALSGDDSPSVIRIRIEGLKSDGLYRILDQVIRVCEADLDAGAMVTVTESRIRVRRLPLIT